MNAEHRTKNVGTVEMRNNAFLNCSSFVVLSSSFVLTYSPERALFTVPKSNFGQNKNGAGFYISAPFLCIKLLIFIDYCFCCSFLTFLDWQFVIGNLLLGGCV